MAATADFSVSCTVSGLPEQSSGSGYGFYSTFHSSNAHGSITAGVATTAVATAPGIVIPSSATVLYFKAVASSYLGGFRIGPSTGLASTEGTYLGSPGPSLLNVASTVESTVHVWTTAGSTVAFRAVIL